MKTPNLKNLRQNLFFFTTNHVLQADEERDNLQKQIVSQEKERSLLTQKNPYID